MNRFEFYGNIEAYKRHRDELKHYGTIGQKWGVRKWQNPDGTFNEAGKERYFGSKGKKTNNSDDIKEESALGLAGLGLGIAMQVGIITAPIVGMAISDAKTTKRIKKYEKNFKTEEIDSETGFKLKNREMSTKEDMKYVNMEHNYFGIKQKNEDAKEGSTHNCSLCTTAMVLRQRGYDVRAGKDYRGAGRSREDQAKAYKNGKFIEKSIREIMKELKEQPEGSYGHIGVTWRLAYGGAHSMFYKIENGKPVIYDAQINRIMKEKEIYKYASPGDDLAGYMRCDNLELNVDYIKENKLVRWEA